MEYYFLMNKDKEVALLEAKEESLLDEDFHFSVIQTYDKLPLGFDSIGSWLNTRKASKHNDHLKVIMHQAGWDQNKEFIRITHATSINDSFWLKSKGEKVTWRDISPYQNQFADTISKLAFEGVGLWDFPLYSTSPELSCEGSFRKCFRKEHILGEFGSDIFLYKRGHELGRGLEPYCEQMASEIAGVISPQNYVSYERTFLHGKLASKCNLFTNDDIGYVSFRKISSTNRWDLVDIMSYFSQIGSEQSFRELLVIDALCFNQDRHTGNYGVLFRNDTLDVVAMAPIFDLNISLLPYVEQNEFADIGDRLFEYGPKLGEDFTRIGQIGLNDTIRKRVRDLLNFSFIFQGDDIFSSERVHFLEHMIHKQAKAILAEEKLYTSDIFPPKRQLNAKTASN